MADEVYSEIVTFEDAQAIRPILGHLGSGGLKVRHPKFEISQLLDSLLEQVSPNKRRVNPIDEQAMRGASKALLRVRQDVDYSGLGGCQIVFRTAKEREFFQDARGWAQAWGLVD